MDGDGDRPVARGLAQPVGQRSGGVAEVDVGLLVQERERGAARGDRERVPAQRARLVDVAGGRDPLQQRRRAAERRGREPAADDLAHHREVGQHTREFLRAAGRDAEAGDDLVEDQQRVVAGAEVAQQLEEARRGRDQAHVGRVGLDQDRRELVLGEGAPDGLGVVPRHDDRVRGGRGRHARATRGCPAWPGRSPPARAARRRGRGRRRRTSGACRGRWRRARAGSRSSTPRCPTRSSAACRPTASAR